MKKYSFLLAFIAVTFGACIKDRIQPAGTIISPPINTGNDTLVHYWNCNGDSASILLPTYTIGGASLSYAGTYNDYSTGSTLNVSGTDVAGGALRLYNPATTFTMAMPTTRYKNIVLKYAVERSSKGCNTNNVSYTVDGTHYITTAIASQAYSYSVDTLYNLVSYDFSSDTLVNNNANFKVQISFSNAGSSTSGNDRYDNISLLGEKK